MKNTRRASRHIAIFFILNLVFEITSPTVALALTSAHLQPERGGFVPASSTDMVDLFTGDFKYNIPLLDVDGYPVNIAYCAGAGVDQEAGWVGLGWSLNPGALNKIIRGLPDDFNGDVIENNISMKPEISMGAGSQESRWIGFGASAQTAYVNMGFPADLLSRIGVGGGFGVDKASTTIFDNYSGYAKETDNDQHFSLSMNVGPLVGSYAKASGMTNSSKTGRVLRESYTSGVALSRSDNVDDGVQVGGSLGFGHSEATTTNYRSNMVMKSKSNGFQGGISGGIDPKDAGTEFGGAASIGFGKSKSSSWISGSISYLPSIPHDYEAIGVSYANKSGFWGKVSAGVPSIGLGFSINGGILWGEKHFLNRSEIFASTNRPSFGYQYSQNASSDGVMDFNRFRDGSVMEETPNCSYASAMYDIYFAAAQGLATGFRPFRNDIGSYKDPKTRSFSSSSHNGYEDGGPLFYHNLTVNSETRSTGISNSWASLLQFLKRDNLATINGGETEEDIEKMTLKDCYFKQFGELAARDNNYLQAQGGENIASPLLLPVGTDYNVVSTLFSGNVVKEKREKRTNHIKPLTAAEASKIGLRKNIDLYDRNTFSLSTTSRNMVVSSTPSLTAIDRRTKVQSGDARDHLSEICVTGTGGERYFFGIPSYNIHKKSVVFNASTRTEPTYSTYPTHPVNPLPAVDAYTNSPLNRSDNYQLVQYTYGDEVQNNKRGIDNLAQTTVLPPYATSYLLTDIVSPEYVDITGNGPTIDDFGNYVRFNYSRHQYQWREPYCVTPGVTTWSSQIGNISTAHSQAAISTGKIHTELDDKGMYQYGIRENHYVHSIETKNHVAVFRTSEKYDGMGVLNEQGVIGSAPESYKLDAIELYSKSELIAKGSFTAAVPLKVVHFEYDYTLCPGTFNSLYHATDNPDRGKLTLKKLYFTSGSSRVGALSPYEFKYADNDHNSGNGCENNYPYDPTAADRWGSYKPNSGTPTGSLSGLNNIEFPYAEQNKTLADAYAAAWNLSEITTPTGATIKITYEADDYGFVQDEQAGQMAMIYNCVSSLSGTNVDVATTFSVSNQMIQDSKYLIVDLSAIDVGIPATMGLTDAVQIAKDRLFKPDKKLYFRCFMRLAGPMTHSSFTESYYDFISGYADIESCGLFDASVGSNKYLSSSGGGNYFYKYAWIRLRSVDAFMEGVRTNPICKAGHDYIRNYAPQIAFPGSAPASLGNGTIDSKNVLSNINSALGASRIDYEEAFLNHFPGKRFHKDQFCTSIIYEKSFVRAYVPSKIKRGGGHRVKEIMFDDNWDAMTGAISTSSYPESGTTYGQKYFYTTSDAASDISSGVAYYEPSAGGDEISLHQPVNFHVPRQFAPDDNYYQEKPLNEQLYPTSGVGYSKITVEIVADPSATDVCGRGRTVYEFYTARDFPIWDYSCTPEKAIVDPDETLDEFLAIPESIRFFYMTQGSIVKLNDMHGKLRSIKIYSEHNEYAPVRGIEYFYKVKDGLKEKKQIDTQVSAIDETNTIELRDMSTDIDVTLDSRQNTTQTETKGSTFLVEAGIMVVPYAPFLLPDIAVAPKKFDSEQKTGVKMATITKVVQQYGILEKTLAQNDGVKVLTENLVWDSNTGQPILTRTTTGMDLPVYKFSYPGYWAYHELAHEYKRDGIRVSAPWHSTNGQIFNFITGQLTSSVTFSAALPLFEIGDEVAVFLDDEPYTHTKIGDRFWVTRNPSNPGTLSNLKALVLMSESGLLLTASNYTALSNTEDYIIEIVRPINHNRLNETIGGVTSLTDPRTTTVVTSTAQISFTQSGQKILNASAQEYCTAGSLYIDPDHPVQVETSAPPSQHNMNVNPVTTGYYGALYPSDSYQYITGREYQAQPNSKADGALNTFLPYWQQNANGGWSISSNTYCAVNWDGNWILQGKNDFYSPYGYMVQQRNALGIPSAQRFGFNHQLPVLKASNAEIDEVGYESFEEYYPIYNTLSSLSTNTNALGLNPPVFNSDYLGVYRQSSNFQNSTSYPTFTNNVSHTGRNSMKFTNTSTLTLTHGIKSVAYERPMTIYTDDSYYPCFCDDKHDAKNLSKLELNTGKNYLFSMWVRGLSNASDYSSAVNLNITQVAFGGVSPTSSLNPLTHKSEVINGWQKLEYGFTTPAAANNGTVSFVISSPGSGFYLDDLRIQPFNSSMICNVYDPYQLRLCAVLDENNYATIIEYDNSGRPVRQKVETTKAIYTTSENRSGIPKR